jgi:hypothetical protein
MRKVIYTTDALDKRFLPFSHCCRECKPLTASPARLYFVRPRRRHLRLDRLPVAQYPDVVPPTVQVTTRYPGASSRTVIDTVALPIEQQVNGVEGMIYMQSYAGSDGSYTLTVTFAIGLRRF